MGSHFASVADKTGNCLIFFKELLIVVSVYVHTHTHAQIYQSKGNNLWESVLSFHQVDSQG